MVKAIFFDNDGVLVDTEKYFFISTQEILFKQGIELTKEKFIELTLKGNEGGWRLARDKGFSEEEINLMRSDRNDLYSKHLFGRNLLIDGVRETVKKLSMKYKLGIVTSSKKIHFDIIHGKTGILSYFDFILTREGYGKSKPSPEPYLKALEISGYEKKECIVVEDSERGLIAASEAGLKCYIIPNELTGNSDFSKAAAVLENIEELIQLL